MLTLRLDVVGGADGAWHLALSDGRGHAARARLEPAAVERIREGVADALAALPIMARRGHDAARTAAEERAGRCLAEVLLPADLARAFAAAQGSARARNVPLALVVDSADPVARIMPWELLSATAQEAPLEEAGNACLARLAAATDARPVAWTPLSTHRILTWCPTPRDPACRAVLEHLTQLAHDLGLPTPVALDPASGAFPASIPTAADILHVVCHGQIVADGGVLLVGPGDERALGTAAHLLAVGLGRTALVVLDVCAGGSPTADQLGNLAERLMACGASACVAPRQATHVDAVKAFARGLHRALADAEPLLPAVAAGRREVRGLADPLPDARWCNLTLLLAGLDLPGTQVVAAGWTPPAWPTPNARTGVLLAQARALAIARGVGFIGLQHLAEAFVEARLADPALCRLQVLLPPPHDPRWAHLGRGLRRLGPTLKDPVPTPRLKVYGVLLEGGFDLVGLLGLVVADPNHGLHQLAARDLREGCELPLDDVSLSTLSRTLEFRWGPGEVASGASPLARALQVVWGPEDGRVFVPAPGDVLGRWAPEHPAALALYQDCQVVDRHLHRSQLTWHGEGRILLHHEARRWRGRDEETLAPGPVALQAGDLLQLSPATWLRALSSLG